MFRGKSLTYCTFCKSFVHCNLKVNNKSIIKSLGFHASKDCPKFEKSAVQVVKLSIEKSIYDLKDELIKSKKITPCIQPIWESIRYAFDNIQNKKSQ
jgi:hypothetical protein